MRSVLLAIMVAAAAFGQEPAAPAPERGQVVTALIALPPLRYPASEGDAAAALEAFRAAHLAHQAGKLEEALKGYLAFRGAAGRHALPGRYAAMAQDRIHQLHAAVRKQYEELLVLYESDRAKGIAAAQALAQRYPRLPEGIGALQLWHSDELLAAIAHARVLREGDAEARKKGAADLADAVRRWTRAIDPYEAKSLVIELGGPDLFVAGERIPGDGTGERGEQDEQGEEEEEEEGESSIEISGG